MTTICVMASGRLFFMLQLRIKLTQQLPEDGNAEDLCNEIRKGKQRLIEEGKLKKEKPLPEVKSDEIPFDIPENQKWVKQAEVCRFYTDDSIPEHIKLEIYEAKY